MDDDPLGDRYGRALARIARTLNVPVTALYEPEPASSLVETYELSAADTQRALVMLRLFLSIEDSEARARCLDFLAASGERQR